ncbi:ATP-dependent helicase [Aeromicrobium terrae]|uniref:ATP-dependent helicase n=1 Tax=Aeromicrobium terrae TaxID=2498846 RepID=UPI001C9CF196|nr:ATP-dependent DNA helicase [Aeromicrobium terrae]
MPEYVLQPPPPGDAPPQLDPSQQAVVDHRGGPLLVLAGPGTGKTATLVELVVDRVERGLDPADALVLTFGRKAAQELRARIARRLPGKGVVPAMTFHAYCYALVRQAAPPEQFAEPLRLLSAPEQLWRLSELLLGATEMGRVTWPQQLQPALRTRGFSRELADFIGRARSYGLDPSDVHRLADERGEAAWHPVADLWTEYEQVLAIAGETDYSGLVDDATSLEEVPQPRLLVVDEYQDTDPAQVALLQRLVGPATELVAVGDPDQSIYAFRGADVRGIWDFPDIFGTPQRPATTLALQRTRRFGPTLSAASRAIINRIGVTGSLSAEQFAAFRNPEPDDADGSIEVLTATDPRAEAEHIASLLRRAALDDGVPFDQMAVLVRTGRESLGPYERALRAVGLPVEVAGDEIPLAEQPAVRSLLLAARAAMALAAGRPLVPEEAEALLTGPLGHLDPSEMRRLARTLRREDAEENGVLRDSREVVAERLAEPLGMPDGPAARLATALQKAAALITDRATAERVLWALWDGTGWPRRLSAAADHGDESAHRDLDAMVALFDDAARSQERGARVEIAAYIDGLQGQEIPGDTLAERGTRPHAVRVMTAHRAKGLEWDLVVLAGVQDGRWPATRTAGTLLRTERLDPRGDGRPPSFGSLLAEERRLFYVAMTRAKRRLVVTAVESMASDGEQPSRFVEELIEHGVPRSSPEPLRRPMRPVTLRGAVTQLRWLAERGATPAVRAGASSRLRELRDVVPAADPETWWGIREHTQADVPIRPADEPLALSGSAVSDLSLCSLRWFLSREAKGTEPTSTAQGFGSAIHVLAKELVDQLTVDADATELIAHLDSIWHQLDYDTPWIAARERDEAAAAVRRLVRWHQDRGDRTTVGAEHEFVVDVPVGEDTVRLRGSMDRVEVDADGRVHVVDFKTGKNKPTVEEISQHPQLGVYQVAVLHGAVPEHTQSGGAELVHLRKELKADPGMPVVQEQDAPRDGEPFFADDLIATSRDAVRLERFAATLNQHCDRCPFRRSCPAQHDGGPTVGDVA